MSDKYRYPNRRSVLRALGVTGVAGLAGCAGGDGGDGGGDGGDGGGGSTPTATATPTATSSMDGGDDDTPTPTPATEEQIQEWRKEASQKAAEELSGNDQLVFYTSARDKEYLARRTTELGQTLQEDWVQDADLYQPLVDNFRNIEGSRGDLVQRYAQEAQAGQKVMDVLGGGAGSAIASGVPFANIPENVPVSQLLPDDAVNNKQAALYLFPWGPGYNSELVSSPPETRQDLLRDEFANEAIIADFTPPPDSVIPVMLMEGKDYIRSVADQSPQFVDSLFTQAQSVAEGQAPIAWQALGSQILQFQNRGLPVRMVRNPDVWHVAPQWMQMAKEPQHPWASRLFLDFLIRPDHRQIQIGRTGSISLDGRAGNPDRMTRFVNEGNPEIWGRHKYDKSTNALLDEYLKAIGAPVA